MPVEPYFLNMIFMLGVFLFFHSLINKSERAYVKRVILKLTGYLTTGIPFLLLIYFHCITKYRTVYPATEIPLKYIGENLFIISYGISKWDFYLCLITSLILISLSKDWRTSKPQIFILANILIVPFLIFNPLLLKRVKSVIPLNLIGRLTWNIFMFIPPLWGLYALLKNIDWTAKKIATSSLVFLIFSIITLLAHTNTLSQYLKRITHYNKYSEPMGVSNFSEQFGNKVIPETTVISDPYTSYHLPVFNSVYIVGMVPHSIPPTDLHERIRDIGRFFNFLLPLETKKEIIKKYNIKYAVVNKSTIPHFNLPFAEKIFSSNLYPNYNFRTQNNCTVYKLSENPEYNTNFSVNNINTKKVNEAISVFPSPSTINGNEASISWKHTGMILINIIGKARNLSFKVEEGTHHVFYYCILNEKKEIIEEKVFINNISCGKIYSVESTLGKNYWVIFFGNGISPLTVQIR